MTIPTNNKAEAIKRAKLAHEAYLTKGYKVSPWGNIERKADHYEFRAADGVWWVLLTPAGETMRAFKDEQPGIERAAQRLTDVAMKAYDNA